MKEKTFKISNIPILLGSSETKQTRNITINGNSNIANSGTINGNITLNSSLDMRIVQMMLDTLNKNNELLQHLIALQSQKRE